MMPDAALQATERQFIRLLALCPQAVRFYPFNLQGIERSDLGQAHINQYYYPLQDFQQGWAINKLDALIISGTNVPSGDIRQAAFWSELSKVFAWLEVTQLPTLFTCLATHAALAYFYAQQRQPLAQKCWGVYAHDEIYSHPLTHNVEVGARIPHSRFNTINVQQFQQANIQVLMNSSQVGVHLAQCNDRPFTFFQGHPEYDYNSLIKEYKREVALFLNAKRPDYPNPPDNYLNEEVLPLLQMFKQKLLMQAQPLQFLETYFPETQCVSPLNNTWMKHGSRLLRNWIQQFSGI